MVLGGTLAMGTGTLTINGGTLAANNSRTFTGRFTSFTIGGDFTMGAVTTSLPAAENATNTANISIDTNPSLGAATRTITIGSNATYTLAGIISGNAGSGLTVANASGATGKLTLTGANNYTGDTTINGGTLALSGTGSIANSPNIVIAGGSTFDVTGLTTTLTLASGQGLKATGSGASGTITTSATKGLTTAANSPLQFTAYDGTTAPLTISGAGTVALVSGNPVSVTKTGLPLGLGDYTLISKGANGSVGGTVPSSVTVTNLAPGMTASLQLTGSQLVLHVAPTPVLKYRSKQNGNWNDFNTWQVDAGGGFVNATVGQTPTSADDTITIQNAHTVTVTASVNADQLTVNTGALLLVNNGVTFTIDDGAGADMTVASPAGLVGTAGTITNNGQAQVNGVLRIDQGGFPGGGTGTYAYDQTIGTLAFNNTSGAFGVNNVNFWPTSNGPQNVSVASGGIQMNVARTLGLTFQTSGGAAGAGNLTFNGLCTIFTGGFFSGSPNYGANSTLVYSTGGTYGRAGEWAATGGAGYPANVRLSANTTLDFANNVFVNTPAQMSGTLTIDSGSKLDMAGATPMQQPLTVLGNVTLSGNLTLSTAVGGDLKVGGNLATSNPGLTTNNRAVFFNGTTPQTVGSAPLFDYVVVQNTAGVTSNGGIISVNKDFSVTAGASFTSTIGGGSGSLIMQPGSTFTNSGTITADLLVNKSALNLSGVIINTVLQMHPASTVSGTGPTYAPTSTLLYISGGSYNRGAEWSATSGAGYPANVRLQGPSTLEVGANGGAGTARQISASLQVENGSVFQMDGASPSTAAVTVLGDIFNNGTITLSTQGGGDLRLGGNYVGGYIVPASPGTINASARRLHFIGGATQTITNGNVVPSINLPALVVDKTGGTVQPLCNVNVNSAAGGESFIFQTAQSTYSLNGHNLAFGGTITSVPASGFIGSSSAANVIPPDTLVIGGTGEMGTLPFAANPVVGNFSVNRSGANGNLTLDAPFTARGSIDLTNGTVTTGPNTFTFGDQATLTRTNGSIVGNVQKLFGGAGSFSFPVSTAAGYAPVDAQVTAGTGSLAVRGTDGKLPSITGANALTRYWTLNGSGITTNLTFHYNAADVSVTPPATEAGYALIKSGSGVLQVAPNSSTNASTHTATATGVTTFSDWTLAEPASVFGSLQFDAPSYNVGEGGATVTLNVTRTGGSSGAIGVSYSTADGTATAGAGNDYTGNSGALSWTNGDTASKSIIIDILDDAAVEGDEAFNVNITNPTGGAVLGTPNDVTVTIDDDDTTPPPTPTPSPTVVYVDDDFTGANGTDPDGAGGPATSIGYDAFQTIQGGIDAVANPGTVNVYAGTYHEDVNVNKSVSLIGAGANTTSIFGPMGGVSATTVRVTASSVTVAGFTITRDGNNPTDWNNSGLNSAGIAIQGQAVTGALIRDNIITGNRTGLDFNDTSGHTVRNNVIDFNRTGFIYRNQTDNQTVLENFITNNWTVGVLFLDGSGGTNVPVQSAAHSTFSNNNISANWYGQIVDRQSGGAIPTPGTTNLKNFRGNWFGTTSPVVTTANSAEPGYAAQVPVAYGGEAAPPGGQPDIAGPASANFKYTPFLLSGTDTNVETTPGRGTFGFQGVQAANVVVIRENSLHGWTQQHTTCGASSTGSQSFVVGPDTPPAGAGSLRYQIGTDGDSFETIRNPDYHDTRLSALSTLSYSTYVTQDGSGGQAAYLLLNIDFDNDGTLDDQIFFEPVYQSATYFPANPQAALVTGTWQAWDALHGGWWSTGGIAGANPGTEVKSLADYIAAQPNARIINSATGVGGFRIATGCGAGAWDNFDGNADNLLVGVNGANTTYDLEPLPRLSIDDVTHAEGDSGTTDYTFTVTLDSASDQTVTVDYSTADDTATTADGDYNAVATTQLSFAPGETTKPLTVTVNGDTVFESDEQFFVNLSNPSATATILDGQGTGAITNDDAAPTGEIQFTTSAYTIGESVGTAHISVTRANGSSGMVSATFNTSDGTATAGNDYTAVTNYGVTYNDGETGTKTIDIPISPDTIFEGDETVNLTLSGTTVGSARNAVNGLSATLTITDDDAAPTISINDAFVSEPEAAGTSDATFTVSLSNASSAPVTVDYATADGTATAPDDYNAVTATTLTFAPGQASKTVNVTVNFDALTEGDETFAVNLSNAGGASIADATGTGTITDPTANGQMLISEFRFRGPAYNAGGGVDGSHDEYVELYNNTNAPITVSTTDGSSGWTIAALSSDGTSIVPLATIPAGTVVPARAHYLVANSDTPTNPATGGYSLDAYAVPDKLYTPDIADNAGVALFRTSNSVNFNPGNRSDAAGFVGLSGATADLFREGAGLQSPGANDGQYAFVRKLTSGFPQDTEANAADFTFVSTDGGAYGGVQSMLGAPGPENSPASPVQRNAVVKASLIEPTAASTAPPNRVRSGRIEPGVPNAYGTLSIQRRFKNATSAPITRLRFRVVDITTLNTPLASAPQADMRVLSSTGTVTNSAGATVATVTGLTLEEPPTQTSAGGLNSTLTVALPGNMLAPGNSIDVQFLLGVEQQGNFRFLVNVEALPGPQTASPITDQSNLKNNGMKAKGGGKP
jgi:autotransporter-associated beta strand protein